MRPGSRRPPGTRLGLLLLAGLLGGAAAAAPPAWWKDPIREDPGNLYLAAAGSSPRSVDDALRAAQSNALDQIVTRVCAGPAEVKAYLLSRVRGWSVHAREDAKEGRTHRTWIIVKYPKEELAALRAHAESGPARLDEALAAFTGTNYSRALALADGLAAEYPVGKQPVFASERAVLLAGECHVAEGRPRKAVEACESVLAASGDAACRQEAESRLAAIRADYTNALFRGLFGGRRVFVRCVSELDGTRAEWAKMQKEAAGLVARAGGAVIESAPPAGAAGADALSAQEIARAAAGDGILFIAARGTLNRRKSEANPAGGEDVQFSGTTTCTLFGAGREPYRWERTGLTGWNPLGPGMCLDVLALNVLAAWQADLAKRLDAPQSAAP